jgi:hypothetical protein
MLITREVVDRSGSPELYAGGLANCERLAVLILAHTGDMFDNHVVVSPISMLIVLAQAALGMEQAPSKLVLIIPHELLD